MYKQYIAHRGLYEGLFVPENSMLAFKKAIEQNYAIELDVRITKDNKIVVFHDKNLIRMCGLEKKLTNQNFDDIKNLCLYQSKETIPLFQDVLKLINSQVPIVVEIKNDSKVGQFESILANILDDYKGEFSVCSFNEEVVYWFKENRINFKRGLIYGDIKELQIKFYKTVFLYRFFKVKPDFVSLDYKLSNTLIVNFCKKLNIPIFTWTVNNKKKYKKAKVIFDNLIFENIRPKNK